MVASGARLAWLEAFDGRADVVVADLDGEQPPTSSPPTSRCRARRGLRRRRVLLGGRRPARRRGRRRAARGRRRRPAGWCECSCATGARSRRRCRRAARSRAASNATTRATSRSSRSTGRRGRCASHMPTTRGTRRSRPTVGVLAWHEWDLPNMPWDGSRIALHDRDTRETTIVAGGDEIAVGQPRFSPDGRALAFVCDANGWMNLWVASADGADARPVLDEPHEHAEPSWGPGQRSYAWSPDGTRARVVPQRGRARVARDRRTRPALGARAREGVAPGARLVRTRDRRGAFRRGDADARRGARRERLGPPAGRPRAGRVGSSAPALVEPRPVTWKSNGATVHGLLYRPVVPALGPGTRRRSTCTSTAGRPGRPPRNGARASQYFVERGWAVLAPDYRGSRLGTGASTRRRSLGGGASATSPTSRPGSVTRAEKAGATRSASRSSAAARVG